MARNCAEAPEAKGREMVRSCSCGMRRAESECAPWRGIQGWQVALSWIPSGEWRISRGTDGRLRWWEVPNGECVRVQEDHQCTVHSLKVS